MKVNVTLLICRLEERCLENRETYFSMIWYHLILLTVGLSLSEPEDCIESVVHFDVRPG